MNLDLAALRALEREREIPFDTIMAAIESALLTAYRHTDGAHSHARVEVDRKTGSVAVLATETDDEGTVVREFDDTPHDFGRIAAMTAKQVILQRLREATDEVHFGEYVGRDGDLVTGVIQAHEGRAEKGIVSIDLGKIEGMLPAVRAGSRRTLRARHPDQVHRRARREGLPRAAGHALAYRIQIWSKGSSLSRFRRSPTARSRSPRSRVRQVTVPRSRCIRPSPA